MLDKVGLATRLQHKPANCPAASASGLGAPWSPSRPACWLTKPTGNLDHATARRVFELMLELNASLNTSLVIVTTTARWRARPAGC